MEPTAKKGIFVGYDEISKAYHIYIPARKQTVVRQDVKFEEDKPFRKSCELDKGEKQASRSQLNTSQGTATQVSGVTGSQVTNSSGPGVGSGEEPQGGGTAGSGS